MLALSHSSVHTCQTKNSVVPAWPDLLDIEEMSCICFTLSDYGKGVQGEWLIARTSKEQRTIPKPNNHQDLLQFECIS
jgi:hypothetical protein